jgi:hypothetical protein
MRFWSWAQFRLGVSLVYPAAYPSVIGGTGDARCGPGGEISRRVSKPVPGFQSADTPASSVRLCVRVNAMNSRMYAASAPPRVVAAYSSQRNPASPMGRETT